MNEEEQRAARLLLTGAVGFVMAAEAAHERAAARSEIEPWPAIAVNVCYAFELSLKAFLASRGAGPSELKAVGHDLRRGLSEATAAGYAPDHPAIEAVIEMLSPLHKSHRLRYLEDKSVELPDTRNLIAITHRHMRAVGDQIPIQAIP